MSRARSASMATALSVPRPLDRVQGVRVPLVALWLLAGVLMFLMLDQPAVNRTQEARVLETAREMLGAPLDQWMIPQVNGHLRMQKPPLAYWLTAAAYKLFGVSEAAGRAPAVLAAWGTLGLVFVIARRLFGSAAAFFAGAALLGSMLFARFARLAETDVLGMLFITGAVYALLEAFFFDQTSNLPAFRRIGWCHVAAIAIAAGVMVKGPIAGYPLLFLIAMAVVERRWVVLKQFAMSGALLTVVLLAAPWFAYVAMRPELSVLAGDLENSVRGGKGHWDLPHVYISYLGAGAMPWTLLLIASLWLAGRRWRRDQRMRMLLVWALVIIVPLCFWGNKQRHYILPLMPPVMMVLGWWIDRATRSNHQLRAWNVAATVTLIGCLLGAVAMPLIGLLSRGSTLPADWLLAVAIAATYLAIRTMPRRPAATVFALASVVLMWFVSCFWSPTLEPISATSTAQELVRHYRDVPLVFVKNESLTIVWQLKRIIPVVEDDAELQTMAEQTPGLVAVQLVTPGNPLSALIDPTYRANDGDGTTFVIGPVRR